MEIDEELIKRKLIIEMIIDKLYETLVEEIKHEKRCISVDKYKINESDITYLLRKYDEERFKLYEDLLLGESEEE